MNLHIIYQKMLTNVENHNKFKIEYNEKISFIIDIPSDIHPRVISVRAGQIWKRQCRMREIPVFL